MLNPEYLATLIRFRQEVYDSLGLRQDSLFELLDAALTAPQRSTLVRLSLTAAFRRLWSSTCDALADGSVDVTEVRALSNRTLVDSCVVDGRPLWQHVAMLVGEWGEELVGERGLSSVGAVVGATHPRAVGEARRLLPQSIMLLPGIGAQGATPADVARAFTSGPASALVNVSRSVLYASRETGGHWRSAAGAEAARTAREVWAASGW